MRSKDFIDKGSITFAGSVNNRKRAPIFNLVPNASNNEDA
jgi:ribosome-associated protein YbcJ (S4-like RNA binding protein)